MSKKNKPCPFCGEPKPKVQAGCDDQGGYFTMECADPECACNGPLSRKSIADAKAKWNAANGRP